MASESATNANSLVMSKLLAPINAGYKCILVILSVDFPALSKYQKKGFFSTYAIMHYSIGHTSISSIFQGPFDDSPNFDVNWQVWRKYPGRGSLSRME